MSRRGGGSGDAGTPGEGGANSGDEAVPESAEGGAAAPGSENISLESIFTEMIDGMPSYHLSQASRACIEAMRITLFATNGLLFHTIPATSKPAMMAVISNIAESYRQTILTTTTVDDQVVVYGVVPAMSFIQDKLQAVLKVAPMALIAGKPKRAYTKNQQKQLQEQQDAKAAVTALAEFIVKQRRVGKSKDKKPDGEALRTPQLTTVEEQELRDKYFNELFPLCYHPLGQGGGHSGQIYAALANMLKQKTLFKGSSSHAAKFLDRETSEKCLGYITTALASGDKGSFVLTSLIEPAMRQQISKATRTRQSAFDFDGQVVPVRVQETLASLTFDLNVPSATGVEVVVVEAKEPMAPDFDPQIAFDKSLAPNCGAFVLAMAAAPVTYKDYSLPGAIRDFILAVREALWKFNLDVIELSQGKQQAFSAVIMRMAQAYHDGVFAADAVCAQDVHYGIAPAIAFLQQQSDWGELVRLLNEQKGILVTPRVYRESEIVAGKSKPNDLWQFMRDLSSEHVGRFTDENKRKFFALLSDAWQKGIPLIYYLMGGSEKKYNELKLTSHADVMTQLNSQQSASLTASPRTLTVIEGMVFEKLKDQGHMLMRCQPGFRPYHIGLALLKFTEQSTSLQEIIKRKQVLFEYVAGANNDLKGMVDSVKAIKQKLETLTQTVLRACSDSTLHATESDPTGFVDYDQFTFVMAQLTYYMRPMGVRCRDLTQAYASMQSFLQKNVAFDPARFVCVAMEMLYKGYHVHLVAKECYEACPQQDWMESYAPESRHPDFPEWLASYQDQMSGLAALTGQLMHAINAVVGSCDAICRRALREIADYCYVDKDIEDFYAEKDAAMPISMHRWLAQLLNGLTGLGKNCANEFVAGIEAPAWVADYLVVATPTKSASSSAASSNRLGGGPPSASSTPGTTPVPPPRNKNTQQGMSVG